MASPIQKQAQMLSQLKNTEQLAEHLNTDKKLLVLHALKPAYHVYHIPKTKGSFRLIEDPHTALKKYQRKINSWLQAYNYSKRPSAVYGFCISLPHEPERNIINNALRHCGNAYMLNLDLKDFFHAISFQKVRQIYKAIAVIAEKEVVDILAHLSTYKQRLPMGAPTSPALSNFAMLNLDVELEQWAKISGITYSRYAHDLTFSSTMPISPPTP